jgi:glycerol-3-phosphate acyltransferase PlsY
MLTLSATIWIGFAFLCGSLPFSVWLGRLLANRDVRQYGDGNPGATNALRAGGWRVGLAALLLDISKGALPVGLAYQEFNIQGPVMVAIALAPCLGHAFSPFLGGRGGKAVAVIFGVWIGLTWFTVPLSGLLMLVLGYTFLVVDGWSVVGSVVGFAIAILLFHSEPAFWWVLGGHGLLLAWKHRRDLTRPPALRPWVYRFLHRVLG